MEVANQRKFGEQVSAGSQPSTRDMRGMPSMGGRGIRGGLMNGGMGGRR